MEVTSLDVSLRKARLMVRTSDSPTVKAYWLIVAANLERKLGRPFGGFTDFTTVPPVRAAWDDLPGNV